MSLLMYFLSIVRLQDKDFFGFTIFLLFGLLFSYAFIAQYNLDKINSKNLEKQNLYNELAFPKISSKIDGHSKILTFLVPSLKLYNEVKNA